MDPKYDAADAFNNNEFPESPRKRLRPSQSRNGSFSELSARSARDTLMGDDKEHVHEGREKSIAIASTAKFSGQAITPFLVKHIPDQYAPLGNPLASSNNNKADANTKYCYRHRPDLKCRRQADEPSMDQLQRELETLSQGDQQGIAHVWSLFSAAPSKHRNLMLQGILAQCCFPQLSFLSANVRELIRIDFLTALPPEISFQILCYLDTTSLCKAAQVSQRWRWLADDDVVWHRMCEQHIDRKCTKCGWGLPLLERKLLRATKRQIQLRATGRGVNEWSPDITPAPSPIPEDFVPSQESQSMSAEAENGTSASGSHLSPSSDSLTVPLVPSKRSLPTPSVNSHQDDYFSRKTLYKRPWKDVYKDRFKVGTNWKYGRCTTKIFKGHTNGVMCLQFDDNILATGSYDATIKIWDINTGREIGTLHGHQSGIRCLQFDDTKLISGSIDCTVKVWNWRTGECLKTYPGHRGGVVALHFDSNILVTGSVDKTVRIWNFKDNSTFRLRGHTDWVNAVKIDSPSRTVFSASDDCTVRLWDLETQTTIRSYQGHVGQVQQVLLLTHEFEFEDNDASLTDDSNSTTSLDVPTTPPTVDTNYTIAWPFGYDRPPPPQYMLTSALDSTTRLWEVSSGRCLRTFFGHVEGVWALAADTLRIVTGAEDRMVKVWDPRTGKCQRTFTGHAGPVTCIGLSDSRMCTGSEDCEVRMYSFKDAMEAEVVVS